jgi:hypothetical protein
VKAFETIWRTHFTFSCTVVIVSLPVFQKEATKQKDELTFGINGIVM